VCVKARSARPPRRRCDSAAKYGRKGGRHPDERRRWAANDAFMTTLRQAAEEFLAQDRIAVAGVSRDTKQPANLIYRRLRAAGHEVFAINPNADEVEGDRCYATVTDIPGGVDGVVVVTAPDVAPAVVADCAAARVPRVWFHRGLGPGSLSDEAIAACRRHGIAVIPGGCPNMFGATSDPGHRGMRRMLQLTGKLPRRLEEAP
jgi:predicted CoA-binding protein